MPCNNMKGMTAPGGMSYDERKRFEAMKDELDLTTRLPSGLLRSIPCDHLTTEMREWLKAHQKWDDLRGSP